MVPFKFEFMRLFLKLAEYRVQFVQVCPQFPFSGLTAVFSEFSVHSEAAGGQTVSGRAALFC